MAALWDNAELLEDLLRGEEAAHVNSRDSWGRTPLHAAAASEDSRCLRILLEAGGDANIACGAKGENRGLVARDACGLTPLDIAEKGEHSECMAILKNAAGLCVFLFFYFHFSEGFKILSELYNEGL
ncbi:hypothetical protein J437_LFUL006000 [Ladona fulva]|uniref:Uncharacterized protein n=1 Tax=Ladona fulva TaxID=123851 RepID=A0A8K0NYY8_LADFU|nr:hypothetical protein J437_LFUL006000 [Ladona fulva]